MRVMMVVAVRKHITKFIAGVLASTYLPRKHTSMADEILLRVA
jgi:hypothetical protein